MRDVSCVSLERTQRPDGCPATARFEVGACRFDLPAIEPGLDELWIFVNAVSVLAGQRPPLIGVADPLVLRVLVDVYPALAFNRQIGHAGFDGLDSHFAVAALDVTLEVLFSNDRRVIVMIEGCRSEDFLQ